MTGPGRNQPCPCGSGKNDKHCHGSAAIMNTKGSVPDDMREATENFYKESEEVVSSFARRLEEEPAPAMIYRLYK